MTITTTTNKQQADGDGVAVNFPFPNLFFADSDLVVTSTVKTTEVDTLQVIVTDYTVTGAGNPAGGTVVFNTPPADTVRITIVRVVPQTQGSDYINASSFDQEVLERDLDENVMMVQQLQEEVDRAITLPASSTLGAQDLPPPVANQLLGWNSAADGLENKAQTDGTVTIPTNAADAKKLLRLDADGTAVEVGAKVDFIPTTGDATKLVKVNAAEDALELGDTLPEAASGDATKLLKVNATEDGVEFDAKMPNLVAGDLEKILRVNSAGDGYDLSTIPGRNAIINGSMRFDQRDSDTTPISAASATAYAVDRWLGFDSVVAGTEFTMQRDSATPPDGFEYYLRLTNAGAGDAAAGEGVWFAQYAEGFNVQRFGFGKTWAKELTLSFWVRSSDAGTYCVSFRNTDASRHYVVEYTINAADTWEYKTISITADSDTGATWIIDAGRGLRVSWDLGSGSNTEDTPDVWAAGNATSTTNQFDWRNTASATFDLTGVQLELGSQATDFEHVDYATELAQCNRYYGKSYPIGTAPGAILDSGADYNNATSTGVANHGTRFGEEMRATPTVVLYSPVSGDSGKIRVSSGDVAATASKLSAKAFSVAAGSITASAEVHYQWTADAEL